MAGSGSSQGRKTQGVSTTTDVSLPTGALSPGLESAADIALFLRLAASRKVAGDGIMDYSLKARDVKLVMGTAAWCQAALKGFHL